jgi:hypothetical protein
LPLKGEPVIDALHASLAELCSTGSQESFDAVYTPTVFATYPELGQHLDARALRATYLSQVGTRFDLTVVVADGSTLWIEVKTSNNHTIVSQLIPENGRIGHVKAFMR